MGGLFENIENASISEGGNWLQEGDFLLEVNKVISKKRSKPGKMGYSYIVELTVLESNNTKNRKGSLASYVTTSDKPMFLGNVKAFVAATCAVDVSEVDQEAAEATCHEKNPLKGKRVRAQAFNTTLQNGSPFTKIKWSPATPEDLVK